MDYQSASFKSEDSFFGLTALKNIFPEIVN